MKFNLHKTHPILLVIFGIFVLIIVCGFVFINNKSEAKTDANESATTNSASDVSVPSEPTAPTDMDAFAKCLTEKGAALYGASWCPHCQKQKKAFGESVQYINYIECAADNESGQAEVCATAGIKGYPTWQFVDGSEILGEATFKQLSEKTLCPL
ncbi:MAG: thioredoxin domain-containing protein [Patescibacteria group bacterium]